MKSLYCLVLCLFCSIISSAQGPEVVIPRPLTYTLTGGEYVYTEHPDIKVVKVKEGGAPESYELNVTKRGVRIKASSEVGEFYARQTLAQMTRDGECKVLQCCEIKDAPRFPYRGLHVDVSRHFRSIDFLKK